jgi:hypothetical protein
MFSRLLAVTVGTIALLAVVLTAQAAQAQLPIATFEAKATNPDGSIATQAGSHPDFTTKFVFPTVLDESGAIGPVEDPKDITVDLPAGLIGNPSAVSQCSSTDIALGPDSCPVTSQVGRVEVATTIFGGPEAFSLASGLYSLVPPAGVAAEFGFDIGGIVIRLDARVRSGSDDGISIDIKNISQALPVIGTTVTFWGVPAAASHDEVRGNCLYPQPEVTCPSPVPPVALLTLPTECSSGPSTTTMTVDSWQDPTHRSTATWISQDGAGTPVGLTGCEKLPFAPVISAQPDTASADTPAGLSFDVKVPQAGLTNPTGLAAADLRNTTVTLPVGVTINPGQAAGLAACQAAEDGVGTEAPPACPAASKVGTVQITTPLLSDKLEGNVYVLQSNPPDLKLLLAASADGVNLKIVGDVHLDASTGQLTATFANTPQLPFTDLKLAFSGGAQAALSTPPTCGTYGTAADFSPWTAPFAADALASSSFAIDSGPAGSACVSTLPFSPSLIAGATTDQAGGYTGFSLLLSRGDGQQRVSSLQFKTPEGLLGMISKIPLCPEPQAAAGTCSSASQVGHTVVAAGPGPFPLYIPQPGGPAAPIYLTGPYAGAPYGLVIAVPVVAGPFNLGTVVVRASIKVDPHTSQLTITTDPLPSILTEFRRICARSMR